MDVNQFLLQNATAVMGIIGVIIGSVLTSIPIILLQLLQRRWQLQDETRQWRRSRLLNKLSIAQDWLDDVLKFTVFFETWFSEHKQLTPAKLLKLAENDLGIHAKDYEENEAIMFSRVASTGDDELLKLIVSFRVCRANFLASVTTNDENKITTDGFALQMTASKISRRIEYMIEKASPIGASHYDKSVLRNFLQKLRTQKKDGQVANTGR